MTICPESNHTLCLLVAQQNEITPASLETMWPAGLLLTHFHEVLRSPDSLEMEIKGSQFISNAYFDRRQSEQDIPIYETNESLWTETPCWQGRLWKAAYETVLGLWIGNMHLVDNTIQQTVGSQRVPLWYPVARLLIKTVDTAFFNPIYKWWDAIMAGVYEQWFASTLYF